jgi:hypothetical protein
MHGNFPLAVVVATVLSLATTVGAQAACADLDGDGDVSVTDLLKLLGGMPYNLSCTARMRMILTCWLASCQ